ncbi:MAG: DNA mismatch repair endonuclease MutL [Lachnospiraceae bacterium]|nr:DNA mismatch repair endonuclease MutL [Lachnospiraceae bacterium]
MVNIKLLDQETINQIAAGEVIDRPASIVKELMENAIDAGSTAITVEIKDGGISFIRITDNGCGIDKDDINMAFLRHSTSKIRTAADLLTIDSLGFRGEALSSIAAVSQVELITKTKTSLTGIRYVIEGGEEKTLEDIGAPDGTTFIIRNLFYNTPARRKFLKTATTEAGYISDIVEKIALSHPEISIRFINGSQSRIHTSGNGKLKDVIYNIYGRDIAANLIEVDYKNDFLHIIGFIGKPIISRGNRNFENYFINGRFIKNAMIYRSIEEAYKPYMMQHKYPFTALLINIEPALCDVNVHPSKMEIRFRNQDEIYSFMYKSLADALVEKELIPEVEIPEVKHPVISEISIDNQINNKQVKKTNPIKTSYVEHIEPFEKKRMEESKKTQDNIFKEETPIYEAKQIDLFEDKLLSKEALPMHKLIGQLFDTYWLIEYNNSLYIIDQHAAHEKVLYERTMKSLENKQVTSQKIVPPIILSLTLKEENLLKEHLNLFTEIGYEIEHFGGNEYAVRAVPDNLFSVSKKELLMNMLDTLADETSGISKNDLILEKIASMSCKAAVKGNMSMSYREADELIKELLTLDNPYNCPHGRPTIISMTKYELEKKFKRIV